MQIVIVGPITAVWLAAEPLLLATGQEPVVAAMTAAYMRHVTGSLTPYEADMLPQRWAFTCSGGARRVAVRRWLLPGFYACAVTYSITFYCQAMGLMSPGGWLCCAHTHTP